MGKAFLIASGKGGTRKSMFAVNFGATLAKGGAKVVILDLDLGLRNLDLYFGLENNVVYDVYDVLTGVCRIKQALIRDKRFDDLYLMPSSLVGDAAIRYKSSNLLSRIKACLMRQTPVRTS